MLKYTLLMIAIPLSIANVSVNVMFWTGHVEGVFADVIAALWAVGLTLVEVLFPAWAITHYNYCKSLSIIFYIVGFTTAVFSILVFAMTIDNILSHHLESLEHHEQAKIQQQEKNQLQKELAQIQLQAAKTAIDAANKYNAVDKISLGTMPAIKQADILAEKIHRSLQEEREEKEQENAQRNKKSTITNSHPLTYLLTLEKVTGLSRDVLKITLAIILGLLIEVSVILSIAALARSKGEQNHNVKEEPFAYSAMYSELQLRGKDDTFNTDNANNNNHTDTHNQDVNEPSTNVSETHDTVDGSIKDTIKAVDNNNEKKENELTLIARVRRDILNGLFGDVPKLSYLPKQYPGTGLRYPQVQKLREQMIQDGEAVRVGKSRMKLKRVGDDHE